MLIAIIYRNGKTLIPRGESVLLPKDQVLLAAEGSYEDIGIRLREFKITERHPWAGRMIADLNLERQELIVLVRRDEQVISPRGNTLIAVGDSLLVYTKRRFSDGEIVEV